MHSRVYRWGPALVYMALIFYSSSQPDPAPILTKNIWDKLLHGGGYAVLGLLDWWALRRGGLSWRVVAVLAIALASAYAATDEFHQKFTPGRTSDVEDWIADTVGAAMAVVSATVLTRRFTQD